MISVAFADEGVKAALRTDSVLANYIIESAQRMDVLSIVLALGMGLVVGLLIAFTYKICYRGVLYSPNFSLTLIMLTLITTPVVMCIKSDIALSMGMVGALSIVRFRTAVKEPMDTAYMFWALTMGILLGAGLYPAAIAVALGISIILFLLTFLKLSNQAAYLLLVHYDEAAEGDSQQRLRSTVQYRRLRSKTVTRNGAEMTVEVRLQDRQSLVANVLNIEGVYDATLVACQTEAGV